MDTRASLEAEVLAWLDETGDTSTTQTNVRNAIKQAHRQRLTETDWPFMLWPEPQSFSLVSGQKNYPLHQEYGRPLYFRDVTEDKDLTEVPYRHFKPSYTDEQFKFVLWGRSPVAAHPAAASQLSLVSSDGSDVGNGKGLYLRGMTAGGVRAETMNPSGTTPVSSAYTYLPGGILQLSKFGTWLGDATVTADAGATDVITLFPEETGRNFQAIRLLWTPDAADEIEYAFYRNPNPLNNDESIPDIPYPHSGILVWDALLLLAAYDGRIDAARKEIWMGNQQQMDLTMRQSFLDGQSLGAEAPGVHYIDED